MFFEVLSQSLTFTKLSYNIADSFFLYNVLKFQNILTIYQTKRNLLVLKQRLRCLIVYFGQLYSFDRYWHFGYIVQTLIFDNVPL